METEEAIKRISKKRGGVETEIRVSNQHKLLNTLKHKRYAEDIS